MEKKLNNAIDDLISYVTSSNSFVSCIKLKEQMEHNEEINKLVNEIKILQKKYVKTLDDSIKEELDVKRRQLESIPLYYSYQRSLDEVNDKIEFIKNSLNDYFYNVVNQKK